MRRILLAVVAIAAVILFAWWWRGRSDGKGGAAREVPAAASAAKPAGSGPVAAEQARLGVIDGRVRGPGGGAIPGAVIMATARGDEPVVENVRADGTFAFAPLPAGTYAVVASAPGMLSQREEVVLAAGGKATVELTLASGGTELSGTVSDVSSGPIAGATVTARVRRGFGGGADAGAVAAAITDADGRYKLTLAPDSYRVTAGHPEYVGVAQVIELARAPATRDFRLVPGGAIGGIVKDVASGAPVAGATVVVERDRMGGWTEGRSRVEVRSGSDGRFRAAGLVPGTLTLHAVVNADGRRSTEPVVVPLGVAEQAEGVELWVKAAPYIAGKVVDDAGAPVADAQVFAMGQNDLEATRTEADGTFRFAGVEPGKWELEASAARHQSKAMVPVVLADQPVTGVVIEVARAPSVIGRVEPATAAEIGVEGDRDGGGMLWGPGLIAGVTATAGDDGRFELAPMQAGRRTITAKAADGRRGKATVEVPAAGSVETVIALDDGASIAGKVTDQRGGAVAGAMVLVKSISGGQRRTMIVNGVDALADRVPTAGDGAFVLRGLEAGSYELSVLDERGGKLRWAGAAAGKERVPVKVTLAEREQKQGVALSVALDDGVIRGIVRNPDGTPRADAWVTASLRPEELMPQLPPPGEGANEMSTQIVITDDGTGGLGGVAPVLTDEEGRFVLSGLRSGVYDVAAEADKGALRGRTERVATGAEAVVTLAAIASIRGTVTSGGAPVGDFTVELTEVTGPGRRQQTFHDAAGTFRFPRVDVGRFKLRVTSARGSGEVFVTTEAGKTAEVTVAVVEAAKVHGRLVEADGTPVAGAPVIAVPVVTEAHGNLTFEGPPELTGPDGSFALEVDPGERELFVLGRRGSPRIGKTFTAIAGQDLDLGTITLAGP